MAGLGHPLGACAPNLSMSNLHLVILHPPTFPRLSRGLRSYGDPADRVCVPITLVSIVVEQL